MLPGLLLTGLVLFVPAMSIFRPNSVPALPPEARTLTGALARKVVFALLPPHRC